MSDQLVVNPILEKQIAAYISRPAHALLLHGKKSSGKKALVTYMASRIKATLAYSKEMYIYPLEDKKTISIDQIKQLKISLRTKDESYRIIIIPDADKLTVEAQNSFLKLLEEPPLNVIFILTSSNEHALLTTIRSRLLKIRYIAPTQEQQSKYASSFPDQSAAKFIAIADGRMGLLSALLQGNDSHIMLQKIELAKDILSEQPDERLIRVDVIAKDSDNILVVLDALLLTCNAALTHAVQNNRQHQRWIERLEAIEAAYTQLNHNISAKLVLSRLFLVV